MNGPFGKIGPLTPWFSNRMTDDDLAVVKALNARGMIVKGFAGSSRGPFTARAGGSVGAGSSPSEALRRLSANLEVQS